MDVILINGNGQRVPLSVDTKGRAQVFAITEDEQKKAAEEGREFNINTGDITLTGSQDHACLYFNNNETTDYIVTAVAVGMGTRGGNITDAAKIKIYKNVTAGTIISDAIDCEMISNTNVGSKRELAAESKAYKASGSGKTFTDGEWHAYLFNTGTRLFAGLNIELGKNDTMGITLDPNSDGSTLVYVALIGYIKEDN
jgi:hypothetical protein